MSGGLPASGRRAEFLGYVEAPDETASITAAIEQLQIQNQQSRASEAPDCAAAILRHLGQWILTCLDV